ncbi:MAG: hypothetical protein M1819_005733 [Sarea resinae]|nr:MAG: hypothetical protein M1819_005733 [Sarea resinae]
MTSAEDAAKTHEPHADEFQQIPVRDNCTSRDRGPLNDSRKGVNISLHLESPTSTSKIMAPSPFLDPGPTSKPSSLAILHLKRDLLLPTILQDDSAPDTGYDEGSVTNTRFGSFPHSTLIGLPWGSQVRASNVDTGSRGRRAAGAKKSQKRKRAEDADAEGEESGTTTAGAGAGAGAGGAPKAAITASTGFIHLLPPTPESWTTSLPHRTQVVYTPDYSYILNRLRARPGSVLIEAGAGSGSFTHAAARAVYNGSASSEAASDGSPVSKRRKKMGRVWSYEFHEQRVGTLRTEIADHGLDEFVKITHRDVCHEGFLLDGDNADESDGAHPVPREPQAEAIFLDLPAPWLALRHLTRKPIPPKIMNTAVGSSNPQSPTPTALATETANVESPAAPPAPTTTAIKEEPTTPGSTPLPTGTPGRDEKPAPFRSPLNPNTTVRICTFSPCIEQVQRTISTLRQLGWLEIEMVEIAHKRIDVRRERVGLQEEGLRSVNSSPANVDEALTKLREVEGRFRAFHSSTGNGDGDGDGSGEANANNGNNGDSETGPNPNPNPNSNPTRVSKAARLSTLRVAQAQRKLYREGRLIHRSEPELKTHTSYLVFAILPREWSGADEEACRRAWPVRGKAGGGVGGGAGGGDGEGLSKRQMRKAAAAAAVAEGAEDKTAAGDRNGEGVENMEE